MYCNIKIICCFQTVARITEYFCSNSVQNYIALGNRISGTNHTELKFVSCKRKR